MSKYKVGSNQYRKTIKDNFKPKMALLCFSIIMVGFYDLNITFNPSQSDASDINTVKVSPIAVPAEPKQVVVQVATPAATLTPVPSPTELVEVVAEIAKTFEPEGKQVVVKAINCFYSESGLRPNAVGQNKDSHHSKDHGVAQLNDYWHKLTPEEKTEIQANIQKAYKIYKGRGNSFSAWYGKLCNN